MAIGAGDVAFWRALRDGGHLPQDPRVLEIGQANWYGDVSWESVPEVQQGGGAGDPWQAARAFYRGLMGRGTSFTAIDLSGTKEALALDLNQPLPAPTREGTFDVVVNSGTAEHVFDQCQLFRTIHQETRAGGLMVHSVPVSGWPDHGLFNYQPGLFDDLAKANDYEVLLRHFWKQPSGRQVKEEWQDVVPLGDLSLGIALRKTREQPFGVPMQGRYRRTT